MKLNRFAKFSWFALSFNLLVIVWGAYVRASSSGAGCGSHWPLCNGEEIPSSPTVKTVVEFSHRMSTVMASIMVVVLRGWALRAFACRPSARIAVILSAILLLTEALIGAGLVLLKYVAENRSMWRAVWVSGHLVNTFLLIAALTATAWFATASGPIHISRQGRLRLLLVIGIIATLILG